MPDSCNASSQRFTREILQRQRAVRYRQQRVLRAVRGQRKEQDVAIKVHLRRHPFQRIAQRCSAGERICLQRATVIDEQQRALSRVIALSESLERQTRSLRQRPSDRRNPQKPTKKPTGVSPAGRTNCATAASMRAACWNRMGSTAAQSLSSAYSSSVSSPEVHSTGSTYKTLPSHTARIATAAPACSSNELPAACDGAQTAQAVDSCA